MMAPGYTVWPDSYNPIHTFTRSAPLYASYACSLRSLNTSQPASLVSFWWYLGEGGMYMFLGEPCNGSFWRTAWTSAASGIENNRTACGQEPEEPCRLARFPIVESWLWRASDRQEHDHQLGSAHLLLRRIPNELPSHLVRYRVSILIDNYRTPSIFDAELIEVSRSHPASLHDLSIVVSNIFVMGFNISATTGIRFYLYVSKRDGCKIPLTTWASFQLKEPWFPVSMP